jgi:alpha-L-arabinofuranosidase
MQGASLNIHVQSPSYEGPTVPPFTQHLTLHTPDSARLTKFVDASAVLPQSKQPTEIRVAIVNRSENDCFLTRFAFGPNVEVESRVKVYELWSKNLEDRNSFGEEDKVKAVEREEQWDAKKGYMLKNHSFQSESFP